MKNKKSFKVLWNVFLFVICGGSLIYGFVQQRRGVEVRVQLAELQVKVDSLNAQIENCVNEAIRQKTIAERNAALAKETEARAKEIKE